MENPNSLEKQTAEILKPELTPADFELAKKSSEFSSTEITDAKSEKVLTNMQAIVDNKDTVGAPGIDIKDSPLHQNVEAILESDLEELYFSMNEQEQKLFKQKGEQTAKQIIKLISSAKATFHKIFKLIKDWLKNIPRVNKFFIEQEAKIKADKIIIILSF